MYKGNWIKTVAAIITIVGGFGSLILGQVFAIPDPFANLPTSYYNWILAVSGALSTALIAAIFYALADIFDRQTAIYNAINFNAKSSAENPPVEPIEVRKKEPYKPSLNTVSQCPKCGELQSASAIFCNLCGSNLR